MDLACKASVSRRDGQAAGKPTSARFRERPTLARRKKRLSNRAIVGAQVHGCQAPTYTGDTALSERFVETKPQVCSLLTRPDRRLRWRVPATMVPLSHACQ